MKRQAPIFTAVESEMLTSGLMLDYHPLARTLWDELINVDVRSFGPQAPRGRTSPAAFGTLPLRGMGQLQTTSGLIRVYAGSTSTLWGYDFINPPASTAGFTGSANETFTAPASLWSFAVVGNWMVASNGQNSIQIAKDSNTFVPLAGSPPARARIVKNMKTFLLAINTDAGWNVVEWCNSDAPEDWAIGAGKSAGNLTIRELNSGIAAAEFLGNELALYGKDQMATLFFTGAPFYFGYKMRLNGIGAVGSQAVCSDGGYNYGVSRQGVWRTDGFTYVYIDDLPSGPIRDYLQDNVNWNQASKIWCRKNEITGNIEFGFPLAPSGEVSVIMVFDPLRGNWKRKTLLASCAEERIVTQNPISCGLDGKFYLDEFGTSDDGVAISSSLLTRPLLLGTLTTAFYVDQLHILARQTTGLEWRIGSFDRLDETPRWTAWAPVEENMDIEVIKALSGVYCQLEFRCNSASAKWKFQGFTLYGTADGADAARNL